jgi:hypothetical protein
MGTWMKVLAFHEMATTLNEIHSHHIGCRSCSVNVLTVFQTENEEMFVTNNNSSHALDVQRRLVDSALWGLHF